nr:DUF5627 domain-containing protein [uncultured Pedobacter sp.]
MIKKIANILLVLTALVSSCKNSEWNFPDYKTKSVYFAYQSPVRTITQGEDVFDTSLDNLGRCQIMATTGGVYSNKSDVTIDFVVDNSLTQGLSYTFPNSGNVLPMPANYYNLSASKIVIPKGKIIGGVEVQLTDAFFQDPLSVKTTYVIPLKMTGVQQADSILSTKDYTLYAIKYINPWTGNYLRHGKDIVVGKGANTMNQTVFRHQQYVEKDEVNKLNTKSLNQTEFPVGLRVDGGVLVNCSLILTFDDAGNCSINSNTNGITATGTGKFIKKGEKNSWGNKDRDALYLNYKVELTDRTFTSTDTLVMRDRGVAIETFSVTK